MGADLDHRLRAIAYIKAKEPLESGEGGELSYSDSPIVTDLANGLCVTYVLDEGDCLLFLQNRDGALADLPTTDLHSAAVENLAALAQSHLRIRAFGDIHAMFLDGHFEASLILVDDLWDRALAHLAPNGFVAALPARDILAFCDARSPEGVAELRLLVARVQGGDHLLTPQLYRRVGRGWTPYNRH